jgi:hypothetical protein
MALLLLLALGSCGLRDPLRYREMSGFLEDYSMLARDARGYFYADPEADLSVYDRVMLEPVALWRGGAGSLDELTADDLARLATMLDAALRAQLARDYELVPHPGPAVLRITLAITDARESDETVDILRADVAAGSLRSAPPPISAATGRFIDRARIEGEIRDGLTDALLVAAVDLSIGLDQAPSWESVRVAFDAWAARVAGGLREARAGQRGVRD